MPLNTYIEPTAGTALNTARLQQNDNFRSLLTNFAGTTVPTSANLTADGATFNPPNGMLFRNTSTGVLYIVDSVNKRPFNYSGNFTRMGIGTRVVSTVNDIYTNRTLYEQGEFVGTLDTGLLYFRKGTTNANSDFVQIGAPSGYSIVDSNVVFSTARVDVNRLQATSNLMVNTTTPSASLHVVGTGTITGNVALGANLTVVSRIGVSTTNPTSNLHVVGNAYISTNIAVGANLTVGQNLTVSGDINTASDSRLKENVERIENALDKVRQLEGVYYDLINIPGRKMGVIAQQVEPIIPEVVSNSEEYKAVAYGNMAGLLIEAIKELDKDIQKIKEVLNV